MNHTQTFDRAVTAGNTEDVPACLTAMDRQADREIATWSSGALAASLLPPPYELTALSSALMRIGQALAGIYHQPPTPAQLKPLAKAIAGGVMQAAAAPPGRTYVLGDMAGIHTWAMPAIQPELAADIARSAGHAFKTYYRLVKTQRHPPHPEELQTLTREDLRNRIAIPPPASATVPTTPARPSAASAPAATAPGQRAGDST